MVSRCAPSGNVPICVALSGGECRGSAAPELLVIPVGGLHGPAVLGGDASHRDTVRHALDRADEGSSRKPGDPYIM